MINTDNRIGALSVFTVPPLLEQLLSRIKHIDFVSFIYCSKEIFAASQASPKLKGRAHCLVTIQEYLSFKQKEAGEDRPKSDIFQYTIINYQIQFGMLTIAYRKIKKLPVSIPKINILMSLVKAISEHVLSPELVVSWVKKELLLKAADVASKLPETSVQISMSSGARIDLANMLSREDLLDEAAVVLKPLSGKYKTSIYTGNVEKQIEAGYFAEAVETANLILDRHMKYRMLFTIAEAQLKAGHDEAESTFREAIKACATVWLWGCIDLEIAASRIIFRPSHHALAFLDRLGIKDKITCLIRIAEELGRKGYHEKATPLFTSALELINTIEGEKEKNIYFSMLIQSQIIVGHLEQALELSYKSSLVEYQSLVVRALINRGEFDQALKILEGIQPLVNYYSTFISIAEIQSRLKKHEEALAALAKAIAIDPTRTNEILVLTAKIQAAAGHVDEAFGTMNQIAVEYKPQLINELFEIFK